MRRRASGGLLVLAMLAAGAERASAQVSISNIAEGQAGAAPFAQYFGLPTNPVSVYDQLNMDAAFGAARFGLRYELLSNTQQLNTYSEITQRWAEWNARGLGVRAGNFYTILGRGLVQRAFELPGVVIDDPSSELRSAFSRDLDGLLLDGEAGRFSTRMLGADDEGTSLFGGQAALDVWRGLGVGATYLRTATAAGSRQDESGSGFIQFDPLELAGGSPIALPIYAEYAQLDQTFREYWEFRMGDAVPHALYVSSNLIAGPLSMSAEWKDYRDFRLGINDPPSLVREHSYVLPNRATHVLNATSEHGVQLEGAYAVAGWGTLTANHSYAAGTPSGQEMRFEENYVEAHLAAARWPWFEATGFFDWGFDTFAFIGDREIYGGSATLRMSTVWSANVDLERLDATRLNVFVPDESYSDWYASATLARSGWGSAGIVWQRTTDPLEEDPAKFDAVVDPRTYLGGTVSAELGGAHTLSLFAGQRRGGPACTAGTCYEVQPFEGVELRIVSHY